MTLHVLVYAILIEMKRADGNGTLFGEGLRRGQIGRSPARISRVTHHEHLKQQTRRSIIAHRHLRNKTSSGWHRVACAVFFVGLRGWVCKAVSVFS